MNPFFHIQTKKFKISTVYGKVDITSLCMCPSGAGSEKNNFLNMEFILLNLMFLFLILISPLFGIAYSDPARYIHEKGTTAFMHARIHVLHICLSFFSVIRVCAFSALKFEDAFQRYSLKTHHDASLLLPV